MQRYRHYGASCSSSPPSLTIEEVHTEEEKEEEVDAEEEVFEEDLVVQETDVSEEEVPLSEEEVHHVVEETETKTPPAENKNVKRAERGGGGGDTGGGAKYSMFTWFVVLALLGVWSSVAVVYFNVVDYDSVIARAKEFRTNFSQVLQGKLTAYDTDGDGDFDVEDAKVLLGWSKDGGGSANAESLEEVLNILAEEGSDWIYGFFTFLYDVVAPPIEQEDGEEEEGKEAGVALDPQNQ